MPTRPWLACPLHVGSQQQPLGLYRHCGGPLGVRRSRRLNICAVAMSQLAASLQCGLGMTFVMSDTSFVIIKYMVVVRGLDRPMHPSATLRH